ncbi:Hsp20/alpha crystallin family protein [Amycolatopsis alkalitolerans]|uniref:Hsp20/alpha crystallin family protein n=1 Tax=Amycolatopsis alkalitolerans TaxID=2547244 RepID=A0A5C4LS92_9PSEU|nr:Hsp20/alpha crystallin family protein [Amycolatopsis alkalitolerans]TNC21821.1 Hsp20/alpha crystallin family protein [Amycolatopsis alkalitolerans]
MATLIPRPTFIPDVFRLLEDEFGDQHPVRVEDYVEDGTYVVRAELPGMDPKEDIHVTVERGELRLQAERKFVKHDRGHTEFAYGTFARTVRLPEGADAAQVTAGYEAGVLEVRIPVQGKTKAREIPVETAE